MEPASHAGRAGDVPFRTAFSTRLRHTRAVSTSSPTTVDAVVPHALAIQGRRVLERKRPDAPAIRGLRRAFDVIADLGALVLIAWAIPFVILVIASPVVLVLWAIVALIRWL